MAARVLSTDQAKSAIQQVQAIINGGLTDQISRLDAQGKILSNPDVWDGPLAQTVPRFDLARDEDRARPRRPGAPGAARAAAEDLAEHHDRRRRELTATLRYDEPALLERLTAGPARARALFAASCAERVFGLYARAPERLRAALDAAWEGENVARWLQGAEALVPDDDPYGENAAAAVAYALRTRATDEPKEAAWAARQVYEAADFAAQQQLESLDLNAPGAEDQLADLPVVQEALAGIADSLSAALADTPAAELRRAAREGSARLLALLA